MRSRQRKALQGQPCKRTGSAWARRNGEEAGGVKRNGLQGEGKGLLILKGLLAMGMGRAWGLARSAAAHSAHGLPLTRLLLKRRGKQGREEQVDGRRREACRLRAHLMLQLRSAIAQVECQVMSARAPGARRPLLLTRATPQSGSDCLV